MIAVIMPSGGGEILVSRRCLLISKARTSDKSRHRQWVTHNLASWLGEFEGSGCVGCGRCITWCPVGIETTDEIQTTWENSIVPQPASMENHNANT